MLDRLPTQIDPVSFAERRKQLSGTIEFSELPRLSEILLEKDGILELEVSFDKEGRLAVVSGDIKANLTLECQSCLESFVMPIDKHFKLGVVESIEQADKLTSDCEPLILEDERVSLNELVEDEVLLAIPDFPRHDYQCVERDESFETIDNAELQQSNSNNPFSVLAKLKNTGDK